MGQDRCHWCDGWIGSTRLTLPRAVTGDLVFCGWSCEETWRAAEVNRVERVLMELQFVQLAADAIQRRHPQADWLVRHGCFERTGLTDRALTAAVERLSAWLTAHPTEQG